VEDRGADALGLAKEGMSKRDIIRCLKRYVARESRTRIGTAENLGRFKCGPPRRSWQAQAAKPANPDDRHSPAASNALLIAWHSST